MLKPELAEPLFSAGQLCKKCICILCAAHLTFAVELRARLAVVALLGRFLPRLGPHGPPRGPFSFLARCR